MSQHKTPQPPRPVDYPVYSEAEKETALLQVIKFVLSIPESRLKPKKMPEEEQAKNG